MQEFIKQKLADRDKQWIYKLIRGEGGSEREVVYVDTPEFMICRDLHPGTDERFLVVFKDLALQTIRDLRGEHVGLLRRVQRSVCRFLSQAQPQLAGEYRIFFHYTPSVFQLHAHVSMMHAYTQRTRVHPLSVVVQNLEAESTHYRDALILISLCRSMKSLSVYNGLFALDGVGSDGNRSK